MVVTQCLQWSRSWGILPLGKVISPGKLGMGMKCPREWVNFSSRLSLLSRPLNIVQVCPPAETTRRHVVRPGTWTNVYNFICVVYGEWVNLVMVSAWHLVLWTSSLYPQRYIVVSLSSDKWTYCESLWIKASDKRPECKCECTFPNIYKIDQELIRNGR